VTKLVDQEDTSPSSSLPAYVFEGPDQVVIRTRTNDQPKYVDTRLSVWTWYDGGLAMKVDWVALKFSSDLMEICKSFMAYALEKYSPRTAQMFANLFHKLSKTDLASGLPWGKPLLITTIESLRESRRDLVGFRIFYRWAVGRGIEGFDLNTYLIIKEIKSSRVAPYDRIYLSQSCLEISEEAQLLKRIEQEATPSSWENTQINVLLHLGF